MTTFIIYLIEANVGLIFFYLVYWLALRKETQFSAKRLALLLSILFSITFPLFHFDSSPATEIIPSAQELMPGTWLPELMVGGTQQISGSWSSGTVLQWIGMTYVATATFLLVLLSCRLAMLLRLFLKSKKYARSGCFVCESDKALPTFSFLRFIFVGHASRLSTAEKEEIILHELVHARKLHSIDRLAIHLVGIIFWFNPIVRVYKRAINQIHEFEADACTVDGKDVEVYCDLIARLALKSSEYSFANHFSSSLTLKRITMMKTIKQRIQVWKLFPLSAAAFSFFFFIACQDQTTSDLNIIKQNSTMTSQVPAEVKTMLEKLKKEDPAREYVVIENTPEGTATIDRVWKNSSQYGIDKSIMRFVTSQEGGSERKFTILQKNLAVTFEESTNSRDKVFTVVEEMATPEGGMEAYGDYLRKNITYPDSASKAGIEGRVFVSFVVNTDGKLSDFTVVKSLCGICDKQAVDVISGGPVWKPARQEGAAVRQRMIIPINFSLSQLKSKATGFIPEGSHMDFAGGHDRVNGKVRIEGTVWDRNGKPISDAHAVLKNTNEGTTTGSDGHFRFQTDAQKGTLVITFVGFKPIEYNF